MKTEDFVIWQDVPVKIRHKCVHVHSVGGKIHKDFCNDLGDIPVCRINRANNKIEKCENLRGLAYAKRRDIKYRTRPRFVPETTEE